MVALADLIVPLPQSTIIATQLGILQLAGFPVTSWQSGSLPLTLIQADAQTLADMSSSVSLATAGGLISLATGGWMDLIASSHYQLPRKSAVVLLGLMTLSDTGGGGPFTITPFQLYAGPPAGALRYQNTTGGTLPKNGTLQLAWQAEVAGSAYNLANGAVTSLLTPLPGVTVANPDPQNGSGTWVTQAGTDAESDASLGGRCTQRWSTLGGGAPVATYQFWAVTSTPTVTRVQVLENTPQGGSVTLYCAGSSQASSAADVAAVNTYIQAVRPLCVTVIVAASNNRTITLAAVVTVKAAQLQAAQAQFNTNLNAIATSLPIGATVYFARLIDLFESIAGVVNVVVSTPSADVVMNQGDVAIFATSGVVWTSV
jgi:uncharacterized phage protein gp47/JayE